MVGVTKDEAPGDGPRSLVQRLRLRVRLFAFAGATTASLSRFRGYRREGDLISRTGKASLRRGERAARCELCVMGMCMACPRPQSARGDAIHSVGEVK